MSRVKDAISNSKKKQRRAVQLKRDFSKEGFGASKKNMTGSLIRTDAKVGDINSYVSYAATNDVPYFISTYSRHEAFSKIANRKHIVSRITGELDKNTENILKAMAAEVRLEESKKLSKTGLLSIDGIDGDPKAFTDYMNNIEYFGSTMPDTINTMVSDVNRAYFAFMDEFTTTPEFMDSVLEKIILGNSYEFESGDFTKTKTSKGKFVNYSISSQKEINKIADSIANALRRIDNKPDLFEGDLQTLNSSLFFLAVTVGRGKAQGDKLGFNDGQFKVLVDMIRSIAGKIEAANVANAPSGESGSILKTNKNVYAGGYLMEILSNWAISEIFSQLKVDAQVTNPNVFGDVVVETISGGKDYINKTADILVNYGGVDLNIDVKSIGKVKQRENNLIYQSSVNIDFGDEFQKLISDEDLSPGVRRLYSSYVLNYAAHNSYSFWPEERSMLISYYFNDKENIDHKFKVDHDDADIKGYPVFVMVNGKFMLFSEVIEQMASVENIITASKSAPLADKYSLSQDDALKVYYEKIEVSKGQDGKLKKIKGFSSKVNGVREIASDIMSSYKTGRKTPVQFGISRK